jgi:hypothetical protein
LQSAEEQRRQQLLRGRFVDRSPIEIGGAGQAARCFQRLSLPAASQASQQKRADEAGGALGVGCQQGVRFAAPPVMMASTALPRGEAARTRDRPIRQDPAPRRRALATRGP